MKFLDLLRMSSSNLLRRKLRTALTVLGVVIGTASIVAVSYTHLNGYNILLDVNSGSVHVVDDLIYDMTVSYTHLDG